MSERQYISALKLRANVMPTRECMTRGREAMEKACRLFGSKYESCAHILGKCVGIKEDRIARHNRMCCLLVVESECSGWTISVERRICLPDGSLLIPDLVFVKGERALVVDVTVRYESGKDTLDEAHAEKVAHYTPVAAVLLKELTGVKTINIFGFPIRARGKWRPENGVLLGELGMSGRRVSGFPKKTCRLAMLSSLRLVGTFLRRVGAAE